jgi:DNA-binding protein HU-beta
MIAVRPRNALRACTARPAGRRAVRARDRPLAASAARAGVVVDDVVRARPRDESHGARPRPRTRARRRRSRPVGAQYPLALAVKSGRNSLTAHSHYPRLPPSFFRLERGGAMTKSQLVTRLADAGGVTRKQADDLLTVLIDTIVKTVKKGESVKLPGLGIFRLRKMKARIGRNPQTGEAIKIPARKKVGFSVAKTFKETVLGKSR